MNQKQWKLKKLNIMKQMLDVPGVFGVKSPNMFTMHVYCDECTQIGLISTIMDMSNVKWHKYNDKRVNCTRRVKICVNWHYNNQYNGEITPIALMACGHGENNMKSHQNMHICAKSKQYMQELVEIGELDVNGCETCTIEWLCSDCDDFTPNPPWMSCKHAKYG
jgi:hypothetical protein